MYKLTTYLKDLPLQSVSFKKNLQVNLYIYIYNNYFQNVEIDLSYYNYPDGRPGRALGHLRMPPRTPNTDTEHRTCGIHVRMYVHVLYGFPI